MEKTVLQPFKPVLFGKLYLPKYLWLFVVGYEKLAQNEALDLTKVSLIRTAIKSRLVTKMQLGIGGDMMDKKQYPSVLRFSVSAQYEKSIKIYLTQSAQLDINVLLRQYFVELANLYIQMHPSLSAQAALIAFMEQYGIGLEDYEWESLKKADFRLRQVRGEETYHKIKTAEAKKKADGQILMF